MVSPSVRIAGRRNPVAFAEKDLKRDTSGVPQLDLPQSLPRLLLADERLQLGMLQPVEHRDAHVAVAAIALDEAERQQLQQNASLLGVITLWNVLRWKLPRCPDCVPCPA